MEKQELPRHVSIIMDGNGRWAKARGLNRAQGHLEGVRRLEETIETARKLEIGFLTFYAFSTENWNRPAEEVGMIMRTVIALLRQKTDSLGQNGIRITFIGRRTGVPQDVLAAIEETEHKTMNNTAMRLNIAFNYGARAEIVDAVKSIASKVQNHQMPLETIDEEAVSAHLYTQGQPDPDLLIRTSGELRISNFLLWQLSYAELYFTDKCWPDFTAEEFHSALANYAKRQRRWGSVKE